MRLNQAAESKISATRPKTVLISGASGMLGTALVAALKEQGSKVLKLVRHSTRDIDELSWNPASGEEAIRSASDSRLEGIAAAVHLSGANVSGRRWSVSYKREIRSSRVETTKALAAGLARLAIPPKVLISASAVGFYGDRGDEKLDENSAVGRGFFPELCEEWERCTERASDAGIRVVHTRFGIVLGRSGGALAQMLPLFKLGLGGNLGDGKQWMSWVSEADAVGAILFALEAEGVSGPIDVTSPEPVTNAEFTRELAAALHRPAFMTAPAFALRLAFGEMADEALLASTRALPVKLLSGGFEFAHRLLPEALAAAIA
jgi:uncharacterized protein (TIGR01777 family)